MTSNLRRPCGVLTLVAEVARDELVLTSKVGYSAGTAAYGYEPIHMRHQLEQTLENQHTDYPDIYFLHHPNLGVDDRWLEGAVHAIRGFREQGLVRAIGIRGPHRYAPERINSAAGSRPDKFARFETLFRYIEPDVLAVRDNLLTPRERTQGVLALAARHRCGVLFNNPLGQGLLTVTSLTGDVYNAQLTGQLATMLWHNGDGPQLLNSTGSSTVSRRPTWSSSTAAPTSITNQASWPTLHLYAGDDTTVSTADFAASSPNCSP